MAVKIRLKKMGHKHRPFFRLCAMDARSPRDGRVIEELGTYDPMVPVTDARAILKGDRISYWISVGAQPTRKVSTLIKKYGENGTHLEAQEKAISQLSDRRAASITKARDAAVNRPMPSLDEAAPASSEDAATEATADNADASTAAEGEATESNATENSAENSA